MINLDKPLTTKEASAYMNISVSTLRHYIRQGKITPINRKTWRKDGQYLFRQEDIKHLKDALTPSGLTFQEIARRLQRTQSLIYHYYASGKLKAEKKSRHGHVQYVVSESEFKRFLSEEYEPYRMKTFYLPRHGIYLFQPYKHPQSEEWGRIMRVDHRTNTADLVTSQHRTLSLEQWKEEGFQAIDELTNVDPIHKRGDVLFEFPFSKKIESEIYDCMDLLYEVGLKNIDVQVDQKNIYVDVKPFQINAVPPNVIRKLRSSVKKGLVEVHSIRNEVMLSLKTDIEKITFHVPRKIKELMKERSRKLKYPSMEQYLQWLVMEDMRKSYRNEL